MFFGGQSANPASFTSPGLDPATLAMLMQMGQRQGAGPSMTPAPGASPGGPGTPPMGPGPSGPAIPPPGQTAGGGPGGMMPSLRGPTQPGQSQGMMQQLAGMDPAKLKAWLQMLGIGGGAGAGGSGATPAANPGQLSPTPY